MTITFTGWQFLALCGVVGLIFIVISYCWFQAGMWYESKIEQEERVAGMVRDKCHVCDKPYSYTAIHHSKVAEQDK